MKQISAIIDSIGEEPIMLDVIEFHPYEPSAYVWCAGWSCEYQQQGETIEYFVDEGGIVYGDDSDKPHENMSKVVGFAPEIKAAQDNIDAILQEGN
jgi:hypothetical protein